MQKLIVANWKMYLTLSQSIALSNGITRSTLRDLRSTVVLCPSFIALEEVEKIIKDTPIKLGAQDIFCCDERGAYTGEIGVDDLGELGVEYVLVGHSERRRYLKESDELINQKLRVALRAGMRPILCVGEPLEIRNENKQKAYVRAQIKLGLAGVLKKDLKRVVIAYEPIWAISGNKGHVDNPEDAVEMHTHIRKIAGSLKIPILYGGSVNAKNASSFLQTPGIDGLLIGKASTKASEFIKICLS